MLLISGVVVVVLALVCACLRHQCGLPQSNNVLGGWIVFGLLLIIFSLILTDDWLTLAIATILCFIDGGIRIPNH